MCAATASISPLVGISVDNRDNAWASGTYECAAAYGEAVAAAGGVPVLLPQHPELAATMVNRLRGLVLIGGADPDTRPFGEPLHPRARLMDPRRQAFETALLTAIDRDRPDLPVLGVCLGMQIMVLHRGGTLHQYLPEVLTTHEQHAGNREHAVRCIADAGPLRAGMVGRVVSFHRQAVWAAGELQVVAQSDDGVIEAVAHAGRPFYVGVQWHPERSRAAGADPFSRGLFTALVTAGRQMTPACPG